MKWFLMYQKSTHFPLIYQSPNLVGYGPLGLNPYSGYITFPVKSFACFASAFTSPAF